MNKPLDIVVVTPTYNEKDNLPILAAGVLAHPGFRLLVVDDGSPDGTGAVADALAAEHPGRIANGSVLLLMFALLVFLVGLVSEQISALRFEGRG